MEWDETLASGHAMLDSQHREIIRLANRVCEARRGGSADRLLADLRALIDATAEHFLFEEQLMAETDYGQTEAHSEHHSQALAQLNRFADRMRAGRHGASDSRVSVYLKAWLTRHNHFDNDFALHLRTRARRS